MKKQELKQLIKEEIENTKLEMRYKNWKNNNLILEKFSGETEILYKKEVEHRQTKDGEKTYIICSFYYDESKPKFQIELPYKTKGKEFEKKFNSLINQIIKLGKQYEKFS